MVTCLSDSCLSLYYGCSLYCLFFFKQKTAYEMRIIDWSSDVCSSDLRGVALPDPAIGTVHFRNRHGCVKPRTVGVQRHAGHMEIGRASCRERVCQYV